MLLIDSKFLLLSNLNILDEIINLMVDSVQKSTWVNNPYKIIVYFIYR